jgi:hypothetical protein
MDGQGLDYEVRRYIYETLLTEGFMPSLRDVAVGISVGPDSVREAFGRLDAAHVLVLQESGEILMANPFSAVPTPYVVEAGEKRYWGNCIWDAMGILAMLGSDGRVLTSCPDCNEAMTVEVRGGALVDEGVGVMHFAVPARLWWDNIRFT